MEKIVLGLSGGVDSTLSAGLLRERGYLVTGAYLYSGDDISREKARRSAEELGIDFVSIDIRDEMENKICSAFVREYLEGRTPSPCIVCNAEVKLPQLYRLAAKTGAEKVATGHYARIDRRGGRYRLLRSAGGKDQSYMLSRLSQAQLSGLVLPVGEMSKDQVRALARQMGFSAAGESDSMELCFIPDANAQNYISDRVKELPPGNFVDVSGKVLGPHQGFGLYTVGQRKGLGAFGRPMYVLGVNAADRTVVLGNKEQLYKNEFVVGDINYVSEAVLSDMDAVSVKVRHSKSETPVILHPQKDTCKVECVEPVRAPTPGQAAVFYRGDAVIASGWIR